MTLTDIARASGLSKSTVHRLLARLIELGIIERHRSGYMVSLDLMNLAATSPAAGMREQAMPYLAALHRWSGRSVQLSVLREFDLVYLESITSTTGLAPFHYTGQRVPSNCTAAGKAILAWEYSVEGLPPALPLPLSTLTENSISSVDVLMSQLKDIRKSGIAFEYEEEQVGIAHVAAPILHYNFAVGALSMAWEANQPLDDRIIAALRTTSGLIADACREALVKTGRLEWFPKDL